MIFSSLFGNPKVRQLIIVEKDARKALEGYQDYCTRFVNKIQFFQDFMLKIEDFILGKTVQHGVIYVPEEQKLLGRGLAGSTHPKLYEIYKKYITTRLKNIKKELVSQLADQYSETTSLQALHARVVTLLKDDPLLSLEIKNVHVSVERFEKLKEILEKQASIVDNLLKQFTWFVGREDLWQRDYEENAQSYGTIKRKLYEQTLAQKDQIFATWKVFTESTNLLKTLFRDEGRLLFSVDLGNHIALWTVALTDAFTNAPVPIELGKIMLGTQTREKLAREPTIIVYRVSVDTATPVFPLTEIKYPGGFFVCTENPKYAVKIATEIRSAGARALVYEITLPQSIFKKFFVNDVHGGNIGDTFSEEAYDHAFLLPISRYPSINQYHREGLVTVTSRPLVL